MTIEGGESAGLCAVCVPHHTQRIAVEYLGVQVISVTNFFCSFFQKGSGPFTFPFMNGFGLATHTALGSTF